MLDLSHLVARLGVAALLGSLVGIERERLDWAAGLRDHMLVCVGSALFMIVSCYGFSDVTTTPQVVLDPSRVAAQVVSGIGFLGAGTILVRGEIIKGLTTAASLWATAAVGLATGSGLYLAACLTTGLLLTILAGIRPLERRFFPGKKTYEITARVQRGKVDTAAIEIALKTINAELLQITIRHTEEPGSDHAEVVVRKHKHTDPNAVMDVLRQIDGISLVSQRRL